MKPDQIAETLRLHRMWANGEDGGIRADLIRADLTGANLTGANLTGADLTGANLTGADLTSADLTRAKLSGATLSRADLTGADLSGADLTWANLTEAYLSGADLDETRGVVWARSGPCGIGPRELTGLWIPTKGLVIFGGCFHGSPERMRSVIAAGGWSWPEDQRGRLAASVEKHLSRIEADITEWLAACGPNNKEASE